MTMLIDVRTPEEYAKEHVTGAVNIPVSTILAGDLGALAEVSRDTPIQTYCHAGGRAEQSRAYLESVGFSSVVCLGGMHAATKTLGVTTTH